MRRNRLASSGRVRQVGSKVRRRFDPYPEQGGVDGLRFGLDEVKKREFTALNFILTDGRTLYAYGEQSPSAEPPSPDYYQLYYAVKAGPTGAVLVCSGRLDDERWLENPPKSLLIVSERLQTRLVSLA